MFDEMPHSSGMVRLHVRPSNAIGAVQTHGFPGRIHGFLKEPIYDPDFAREDRGAASSGAGTVGACTVCGAAPKPSTARSCESIVLKVSG